MEQVNYKKIIKKLISTINKHGIPEKVKKWKRPAMKYRFDSYDDFHTFIFKLAKSYDKHTYVIDENMEEKHSNKNKKNSKREQKKPDMKIVGDNILYLKFYHYYNSPTKDWKDDLKKWVKDVKSKIDKAVKDINGLIIDLSQHIGGNMWPAIEAMVSIYGATTLLRFTAEQDWLNIVGNKVKGGKFITSQLKFKKPIAIIVSDNTASSGELIAATFKGRKNTFFVGDNTNKSSGFMSVNQGFYLDDDDNINLILTTSFVETVDKKIHTKEYLRVTKYDDPIKISISKINK